MSYQVLAAEPQRDTLAPQPAAASGYVSPVAAVPAAVAHMQVLPGVPNAREEVVRILTSVRRSHSSCYKQWLLGGLIFVAMTVVGWVLFDRGSAHATGHWDSSKYGYPVWVNDLDAMTIAGLCLGIVGIVVVCLIYSCVGLMWCCRRPSLRRLDEDAAQLMEEGGDNTRIMTWRIEGEQWDRWVEETYRGACARSACGCLYIGGTFTHAKSKRNGVVVVVSRQGLFVDDVRHVVFQPNHYPTHVEHTEVTTSCGSVEQALLVRTVTETFDRHSGHRKVPGQMTLWMPTGVLPPLAASLEPGGDAWLNLAKDTLRK